MDAKYKGWTRYHVIYTLRHQWRFYREGMKRSIMTNRDRNEVIKKALYKMSEDGGLLTVHKEDATVDFVVDNWDG